VKAKTLAVLGRLHGDESGQYLIEYAPLALWIACGAVTAMGSLGLSLNAAYMSVDRAKSGQPLGASHMVNLPRKTSCSKVARPPGY